MIKSSIAATCAAAVFLWLVAAIQERENHADRMAAQAKQARAVAIDIDSTAHRVCIAAAGPGAQALWTTTGYLVCRPAPGGAL